MRKTNGLYFAIATAVISGFSIWLNTYVVKFSDATVFTSSKNLLVAIFLTSILIGTKNFVKLKNLTARDWFYLISIGLIGGSIPFVLFFKGIALTSAGTAGFIHKTMFIWVAIGAIIFLKEKITVWFVAGFILLIGGNLILFKAPANFLGNGQQLIWLAVAFWTIENILVKKFFLAKKQISSIVASWGRMFFGAIFMLLYLGFLGKAGDMGEFNASQMWWILITSVLLLGYVLTWYEAVRRAPVHIVAAILVLGSPITTLIASIQKGQIAFRDLVVIAIFFLAGVFIFKSFGNMKNFQNKVLLKDN